MPLWFRRVLWRNRPRVLIRALEKNLLSLESAPVFNYNAANNFTVTSHGGRNSTPAMPHEDQRLPKFALSSALCSVGVWKQNYFCTFEALQKSTPKPWNSQNFAGFFGVVTSFGFLSLEGSTSLLWCVFPPRFLLGDLNPPALAVDTEIENAERLSVFSILNRCVWPWYNYASSRSFRTCFRRMQMNASNVSCCQ